MTLPAHLGFPVQVLDRDGLAEANLLAAERSGGAERADWLKKAKRACLAALKHGMGFRGGLPEAMRL